MKRESETPPGKYAPGHEHRHGEQCPISACTWPVPWEVLEGPAPLAVLPMRLQTFERMQALCVGVRYQQYDRAMREIEARRAAPVDRPEPAPIDYTRTWPGLDVSVHRPHPKPLIPRRPAREVEIPSAARTVRKLAEASGWTVRPTYALGWALGARGDVRSLTHSLALRMQHGDTMMPDTVLCVAVWIVKEPNADLTVREVARGGEVVIVPTEGWKFDFAYGWGAGRALQKLTGPALKIYLRDGR